MLTAFKNLRPAETADAARRDFFALVSHEIRTPLNAVIGLARLLQQTPLDARQSEMAETLRVNADILLKLVDDLLDLSRIEAGELELEKYPFRFSEIFEDIQATFGGPAEAKGLAFSMTDRTGGRIFMGDGGRLRQIIVNLADSALKSSSFGNINVAVSVESRKNEPAMVRLTVSDAGIGIPSTKPAVVSDRFVPADSKAENASGSSELGLAICKSLAKLMGGEISTASDPQAGSNFAFEFPLTVVLDQHGPLSGAESDGEENRTATRGVVLVVEDYPANVLVASMMLEHLGFEADTAANGEEAVRKVAARDTPYTAILMDVQLPDINGFEATCRIREIEKAKGFDHYIIGVTAHALAGDRERCLEAGMNQYMSKPVHPDILAQKLAVLAKAA